MPNNYTVTISGYSEYREKKRLTARAFMRKHGKDNLCEIVHPMPAELRDTTAPPRPGEEKKAMALKEKHGHGDWHSWACHEWGTKWGTYEMKAFEPGGDGKPIVIAFQCAWEPPRKEILGKIIDWLEKEWGIESPCVLGFEPCSNTTHILTPCQ